MTEMEAAKPSLWVPVPGMYGVSLSTWPFGIVLEAHRAYTFFKGFVIDMDLDAASLQIMRVSNAFPRVTSVHEITVDGVIDIH